MATVAEPWPPTSYRRLRSLMDHGRGRRATGPCGITGCDYLDSCDGPSRVDSPLYPLFVWDHCHEHDVVRGALCQRHNAAMGYVDRQDHAQLRRYSGQLADLLPYWQRCPGCAALGSWQPVMVRHWPALVRLNLDRAAAADRQAARRAGPGWPPPRSSGRRSR